MYNRITNRHFANKHIEWHFDTLLARPQRGAWERIIRSVHQLLTALPDDPQSTTVTQDKLCTMLAGI